MADPVDLLVPSDERFRGLASEVGARYVVAAGGSEAEAGVVSGLLTEAIETLAASAPDGADLELAYRSPGDGIEVTVRCDGRSSVVTHPLSPAQSQ